MADEKISVSANLTSPASGDLIPIVDVSEPADADKNKHITWDEIVASDGSVPLTADWDVGGFSMTNLTLQSFTNDIFADHVHEELRNESGGAMAIGDAVYISGYSVGQERALVTLADASSAATMPCVALLDEATLANNATGDFIEVGTLSGMDTSSWAVGDELYVSNVGTTGNTLTNVRPIGTDLVEEIAIVLRSHATLGIIEVIGAGHPNQLPNIANTKIWIGDATGVPQEFALSGDVTMTAGGVTTVANDSHTHTLATGATDVNATAAEVNVLDLSATALTVGWAYIADGVSTASWRKLLGSELNNDSGWTTNVGTVTSVGVGTGLDVSGTSVPFITLDLAEFTDGTANITSVDECIYLDNGVQKRKRFAEMSLSVFSNDSGWTSNAGTVTAVTGGDGCSSSGGTTPDIDIDAAQTLITSIYNTGLNVGYNSSNYIDFALAQFDFIFDSLIDFRFIDGGTLHANSNVISASTTISSDRKLKENIRPIDDPIGRLNKLKGSFFDMKENGKASAGLIAQDAEIAMPCTVESVDDLNGGGSHLVLNYNGIIGLLVEGFKAQQQEINDLRGALLL